MCITRYLSTTYGHNTDLWSIIILPSGREERHNLYANTTNALESLHRQLNRWVRNYERGNINTIASYLVSLYGELDNEIIIMESGQRRLDINSFDKGLARVICRLDCQRKWHGRVDTLDDVLLFCSELRDAERQAQNVSRSVKQFKEFATRHCIRNPDDFYFFESFISEPVTYRAAPDMTPPSMSAEAQAIYNATQVDSRESSFLSEMSTPAPPRRFQSRPGLRQELMAALDSSTDASIMSDVSFTHLFDCEKCHQRRAQLIMLECIVSVHL